MTQEPNPELLTEADVARYFGNGDLTFGEVMTELRERGLIVPEPVDPILIEAREIAAEWGNKFLPSGSYREGHLDESIYVQIALAALKRGMELAQRPAKTPKNPVPEGQTPLDDSLSHRYLDVIKEGRDAFDSGASSPYHGHSLEHCLHATGWVQRDLRVALDKAKEAHRPLTREMVREAWLKAAKECGGKPVFYDRLHAALTEMMKEEAK
jgi:hypothetical protein